MSSPAAVELISVKETTYGVTPDLATAQAKTIRFTTETLSGTPQTTTSQEVRKDRMSGGQVVTGLESGGDINFELSSDDAYEEFFSGAMMSNWVVGGTIPPASTTLSKDPVNDQLANLVIVGDTGDFGTANRPLMAGDVIILSGFVNAANNGPMQIRTVVDATTLEIITPRAAVTETAVAGVEVGDYLDIGSLINSWTLSKAYTDVLHGVSVDQHSQRYTGSIVNAMNLAIAYGEIITGTFSFLSNGYDQEHPSLHQKIESAGGTVAPAGTENPMNGSIDMPMVTVGGEPTDFCIQTATLNLDNGSTPQNCIGKLAPTKYTLGTANITVDLSIYLADPSYDKFMPAKLSMAPIAIMFAAVHEGKGYAFDLRAVQLSFPDPAVEGQDTPVMINAAGVAKVGPNGSSALRIWRWG